MLDKAKTLLGYKLSTGEGDIGKLKEFYFDDRHWAIRYLVADTGSWLASRQVLISPYALDAVVRERHRIVLGLTRRQIEDEPALARDQAVSRTLRMRIIASTAGRGTGSAPTPGGSLRSSIGHRDPWRMTRRPWRGVSGRCAAPATSVDRTSKRPTAKWDMSRMSSSTTTRG